MAIIPFASQDDLLKKVFQAVALPWDANSNLYVALHTADPGDAGDQSTSEATYTSYARVAVARSSGGWAFASHQIKNNAAVNFPACTGGSNTITYFSIGTAASGTGQILYKGALSASLSVSSGVTPTFATNAITATLS